jgi:phage FluMu protein Com
MLNRGKCPKCEKVPQKTEIESIVIGDQMLGPFHSGISILCPHCKTILGIAIDPISIKEDVVREVLKGLGVTPKKR